LGAVTNTPGTYSIRKNSNTTLMAVKTQHSNDEFPSSDNVFLEKGDWIALLTTYTIGSLGSWRLNVTKVGTQPLLDGGLVERPGSTLFVHTSGSGAAGYGSVNTAIRRFTTIGESSAIANGDVKYTDSATEGMSVEILEDGVYGLSLSHANDSGSGTTWAWTLNSTDLTLTPININPLNKISHSTSNTPGNDTSNSSIRLLRKGDIIRVHAEPSNSITVRNESCYFSVSKLGQTVKYYSRVYKEDPIAWQTKFLSGDINYSGNIPVMDFNNLEIGKTYRITVMGMSTHGGGGGVNFTYSSGGNIVSQWNGAQNVAYTTGCGDIFIAQATNLVSGGVRDGDDILKGNGTAGMTHVILE